MILNSKYKTTHKIMNKRKMIYLVIDILSYCTAIFSFVLCFFNSSKIPIGYEYISLLSLSYIIIYSFFYRFIMKSNKYQIVSFTFLLQMWMRLVLLPLSMIISGNFTGIGYLSVSIQSLILSIILIIYESIISTLFLFFIVNRNKKYDIKTGKNITMVGNKLVYFLFILLGLLVYFYIGRSQNLVQIFAISLNDNGRVGDVTDTYTLLARQIIIITIIIAFIWGTSYFKRAYARTPRSIYLYSAILLGIINISIIVGERRSVIIYSGFISTYILFNMFPQKKKKIAFWTIGTASVVLIMMSIYKFFAAFSTGSYLEAAASSNIDMYWISSTLQSYVGSPHNIAASIDMKNYINIPWYNIIYDFVRSTFGLNFLFKNKGILTSQMFNRYVYGSSEVNSGHVLTSVGYGYIYFGVLFSPIIACLNIYIATKLEKLLYNAKSYETMYLWGYILFRFTSYNATTPPLISLSTMMIFTFGLLYFVSAIMNGRYLTKSNTSFKP